MAKFFTSDSHFGHARIIELCNRPFNSVSHMNAELIRRWNEVVAPEDIVFHLGDVALGTFAESIQCVAQLNGYKIMVPGNHDRNSSVYEDKRPAFRERFHKAYEEVFQEIRPEHTFDVVGEHQVMLSHYPYFGDSQERDRHVDIRPRDEGLPLIHGHIHNTNRQGVFSRNMYHVGVDVHDYYPVHEDKIVEWIKSKS